MRKNTTMLSNQSALKLQACFRPFGTVHEGISLDGGHGIMGLVMGLNMGLVMGLSMDDLRGTCGVTSGVGLCWEICCI